LLLISFISFVQTVFRVIVIDLYIDVAGRKSVPDPVGSGSSYVCGIIFIYNRMPYYIKQGPGCLTPGGR